MKKWIALLLAALLMLSLVGCGGGKNGLVGKWQIVDAETATEYGLGIEFTKDGELHYGLTADVLAGLTEEEVSDEDLEAALGALMTIKYKVKSDTEMEITISAMLGLAKETATVEYKLDGDTLFFDGATYTRVK